MADRTPARGSRTGRLQGKPYDRPDSIGNSAASSRNGSPAPQNRGFLSSVADMLFSPFSTKTINRGRERTDREELDQGSQLQEQLYQDVKRESEKHRDEMDVEEDGHRVSDAPIKPIREALASFEPVDPLQSIHLINDFNRAKKALDQQPTRDERRAIEELIRRADTDSPVKKQINGLRGAASSTPLRSPSRLARSRVLAKESGLSKSSSMNFSSMHREEASPAYSMCTAIRLSGTGSLQSKPTTPLRKAWKAEDNEEPSPPGRYGTKPVEHDGMPESTASPIPALPTSPYPSGLPGSSLRTSASRYSLARPAAVNRFASQRSSGMSKSQSMFSLPKASGSAVDFPAADAEQSQGNNSTVETNGRQRLNALVGATNPNITANHATPTSTVKATKPTVQKTAAAQDLEDMLKQADEEEGRKSEPVAPVVNPYEHYRFNVGASSPRKRPSATDKRAGGLAGRRALLAAAEKKEKERTKDTEMTDLDLIKENMADTSGKRQRVKDSSSPEIQTIEPVAPKTSRSQVESTNSQQVSGGSAFQSHKKSQTTAAPSRSTFSFGPPADATDQPTSSFGFAKSTSAIPHQRKNDALDIIMANAGASPAPPVKLTPAVFPTLPSQEAPPPVNVSKDTAASSSFTDKRTAKDIASSTDVGALPVFVFKCLANVPSLATGTSFAAQHKAKGVAGTQLQSFKFDGSSASTSGAAQSSSIDVVPSKDAIPAAGVTGFTGWGSNPGASTVKANDTWMCTECFLQSKGTSTACDICEHPRPGHAPVSKPAVTGGFTGWGASFNPPTATASASGGDWTCSLCGCKSKATSEQCDVCETKR